MVDIERKLTTIMAADVAGYTAMMERDEEATLETLRAHRATMRGFIERHRGRIANTAGDSVMAEFPSVLEAVTAAAEIQQELGARNAALADDRRMRFRIGINLGDVMVEGADLFGEGVNIAARLESMAEPGGICISGTVYEQVKNKLSLEYDYMGARRVKNISDEIPMYSVNTRGPDDGGTAAAPDSDRQDLAETLGSLGQQLGKIIDDKVDDDLGERIAGGIEAGKLGDVIRDKLDERLEERALSARSDPDPGADRGAGSIVRVVGVLAILAVVDFFVSDGWWVQWPAIVILALIGMSRATGVWALAVIAGALALGDWAAGGGWWSQWPALVAGGIIALTYISRGNAGGQRAAR